VINAQIAALHAAAAPRFEGQPIGYLVDPASTAHRLIQGVDREVWSDSQQVYLARVKGGGAELLPNAMMIIALVRLAQLTHDSSLLERAEQVVGGLQVLWDEERGAYAATQDRRGVDGYFSLSTNTYAAEALFALAAARDEIDHRRRARQILRFILRDLYADGVLYHHVDHGRRAAGDIWCSGCNWRTVRLVASLGTPMPTP
jgi:uncharacterized protein YyaL (SSP411 family)